MEFPAVSSVSPKSYQDETSVYQYFDAQGILLYVGVTGRGTKRNTEHSLDKEWWPFVASQSVEHFPNRLAALSSEEELIRWFRPPFNTQHNPGHAQFRSEYLSTAGNSATLKMGILLMGSLERRLPLRPVKFIEPNVNILSTMFDHRSIGMHLGFKKIVRATNEGVRASVVKISPAGHFALLHVQGVREPITEAVGRVKLPTEKPRRFVLTSFTAQTASSSADQAYSRA